MNMQVRALAMALVLLASAAQAQNRPSFDCAKASDDVEKAICKDEILSTRDREIAAAYADARRKFDPAAQKALKADQELFLAGREISLVEPAGDLKDYMNERLGLLRSMRPGPAGSGPVSLLGEWKNENGLIEIAQAPGGKVAIKVSSAALVTGKWVCEIDTTAAVSGARIMFREEHVTITIARDGGALKVSETTSTRPRNIPYCGHNGGIEGHYFKVK